MLQQKYEDLLKLFHKIQKAIENKKSIFPKQTLKDLEIYLKDLKEKIESYEKQENNHPNAAENSIRLAECLYEDICFILEEYSININDFECNDPIKPPSESRLVECLVVNSTIKLSEVGM